MQRCQLYFYHLCGEFFSTFVSWTPEINLIWGLLSFVATALTCQNWQEAILVFPLEVNFLHQGEIFVCCIYYLGNKLYSCVYPCAFAVKVLILARVSTLKLRARLTAQSITKFNHYVWHKTLFQVGCKFSKTVIILTEIIYASYLLQSEIKPHKQIKKYCLDSLKKMLSQRLDFFFFFSFTEKYFDLFFEQV